MTENSEVQPTDHRICRLEKLDRRSARFVSERTDTIQSTNYYASDKNVPSIAVTLTREEFERRGRPNVVTIQTY